jgi:DNA-binding MarR family transcriptional regulator
MHAMRTHDPGAGPALFRLVRYWSRRWAGEIVDPRTRDVQVLEAIDAAAARGAVSVTDIADELGVDHSGASRMVREAAARGHVRRGTAPHDARRATVAPTEAGTQLLAAARTWQDETFARMTAGWPPGDVRRLAAYLRRLADEQARP